MTKKEKQIKQLAQKLKADTSIQHSKDMFIRLIEEVYADPKLYEQMVDVFVNPEGDYSDSEIREGALEYASRLLTNEVFNPNRKSDLQLTVWRALNEMFPEEKPVANIETMHEEFDYNK